MMEQHDENLKVLSKTIKFLNSFTTTNELAEYLQVQNIKALCGDTHKCAIAEYVVRDLPHKDVVNLEEQIEGEYTSVSVNGSCVNYRVWEDPQGSIQQVERVYILSDTVQNFINRFDEGMFPQLMQPGSCVNCSN